MPGQLPATGPCRTQEWLESLDGPSIVLRTLEELIAPHELKSSVRENERRVLDHAPFGQGTLGFDHRTVAIARRRR